jgi:hypothetical protein
MNEIKRIIAEAREAQARVRAILDRLEARQMREGK